MRSLFLEHIGMSARSWGIVFDYCRASDERSIEQWFDFVPQQEMFFGLLHPIVNKRKDLPFGPEQRNWQELRRGRYVEFNLIHDKGTSLGSKPKAELRVY